MCHTAISNRSYLQGALVCFLVEARDDIVQVCPSEMTLDLVKYYTYIITPGYPHSYEANLDCRYNITAATGDTIIVSIILLVQ